MPGMQLNQIDLNLLVVLDAICTAGGITAAARKLHVTQPALSHALGRLRDVFGDPLFVRDGQKLAPTPLARSLVNPLRQSLHGLEATLNQLTRFDPATSVRAFTLGLRDLLEAIVLPPVLERVARSAPQVDIGVAPVDRRHLEADLTSGALDLAVDILVPVSDRVRRRLYSADRLVVVMRKGHPLAKKRIDLPTYIALEHVVASSRNRGYGLEDLELQRLGKKRRVRLRCHHYYAAASVVERTDLLLTVPEGYAKVLNEHFDHRIVPLPFAAPPLETYVYWHASSDDDSANRWLRAQFLDGKS
jgi:DNA-binding transcriptional LysR family regulator